MNKDHAAWEEADYFPDEKSRTKYVSGLTAHQMESSELSPQLRNDGYAPSASNQADSHQEHTQLNGRTPFGSVQKALKKDFIFKDFADAVAFVNQVAELAEEANHHPDINLSWGRVHVWLTTHSEHRITQKDHDLAAAIDQILK